MQYVGLSGLTQRGNFADETGINLNSFSVRFFPQFKDKLNGFNGQVRGWATPDKYDREILAATGIVAMKMVTAYTFAQTNITSLYELTNGGGNAGGFYLDEATPSSSRDGWLVVSIRASSNPGVS